jgi:hypothetical protein
MVGWVAGIISVKLVTSSVSTTSIISNSSSVINWVFFDNDSFNFHFSKYLVAPYACENFDFAGI